MDYPQENVNYFCGYMNDAAESSIKTSWFEGKTEGIEEGIEKGITEGESRRNRFIALEMIKDGELNDKIRKYTHLTDIGVETLKRTMSTK